MNKIQYKYKKIPHTNIKTFVLSKWSIVIIGILLLGGIGASRTLFRHNYYFNMHDDLQIMRQLELEKCFLDWQIPCRWVPDMGYGFGFPLFNYYPQLPYLFGEVFRIFQLPFNDVAKLTFALGIILSGFSMYILSSEFFGKKGGLLSALFYIWAPYRALDVYVRGAMNESWAFVWFPLILWGIYKIIFELKAKYLIILSLSIAALLLTHNIMVMIFIPIAASWTIFWLILSKKWKSVVYLILSGFWALSLSAFFTIPSIFEQKYVHIETLISEYFEYFAHFATFNQLFISRFWGDGPSVFGTDDKLAFPVGHIHWVLILIIFCLYLIKLIKTRKTTKLDLLMLFGFIIGTGGAFMTHQKSYLIWEIIPPLKFVQFPWRFLTLNLLGYSLGIGALFYYLKNFKIFKKLRRQIFVLTLLSLTLIVWNWNYFKPVHSGPLTDDQKLSGEAWRIQTQAGIRDYLPVGAKDDPEFARVDLAEIIEGKGNLSGFTWGTNWAKFEVSLEEDSLIRVNIFQYPIWKIKLDGQNLESFIPDSEIYGRMYVNIPKGNHVVSLKFINTPLRTISNYISIVAWLFLAGYLIKRTVISKKL